MRLRNFKRSKAKADGTFVSGTQKKIMRAMLEARSKSGHLEPATGGVIADAVARATTPTPKVEE